MSWFGDHEPNGGAPVWLLTVARGGQTWRLTFSASPVTVASTSVAYTPALAGRDRLEHSTETRASAITVRIARTSPLADALRTNSGHRARVRIEKYHGGDWTAAPIVEALGDVANVRLSQGWVLFDLVQSEARFDQPFPSKLFARTCQWPAFSAESGMDEAQFAYDTTITAIAGSVVTVDSIGVGYTGYYNAGQLRFGADASAERAFVDYHVGTEFHLVDTLPDAILDAFARAEAGTGAPVVVSLVPGDDKTLKTRRDRFGAAAVDRFSGFDLLPSTDPLQSGLNNLSIPLAPYTGVGAPAPATPPSGGLPFRTFPTVAQTDTTGSVSLRVDDPDAEISLVESRTNDTGFEDGWTSWDTAAFSSTPPTYSASVTKGDAGYGAVEFRVTYDAGAGPVTQTALWEFAQPFYVGVRAFISTSDATEIVVDYPLHSDDFISFVEIADSTHHLRVGGSFIAGLALNQTARVIVRATGGTQTLGIPTTDLHGDPVINYLAGTMGAVTLSAFLITGTAVFNVDGIGDDLEWTIVSGAVTPV